MLPVKWIVDITPNKNTKKIDIRVRNPYTKETIRTSLPLDTEERLIRLKIDEMKEHVNGTKV